MQKEPVLALHRHFSLGSKNTTVQLADSYTVVKVTLDVNVNVKDLVAEVKVVM